MAADHQYVYEQKTAQQPGSKRRRHSTGEESVLRLLIILVTKLQGDAPVVLDYAAEAENLEIDETVLRRLVQWLVERGYLALDGQVDGVARLWINPAVAFLPRTTDPRVAAARHRFPYIRADEKGLAAKQPVHVSEYDEQGWESVYQLNVEQFENPVRFSLGCPLHHKADLRPL
ncbi:hypothetical protein ACPB9E_35630 [Streptomyces exfoliatus]|uniref:hypothetical protein n=1 Tax=Streptomyces exfoliatus TaxID=1905 RepID=UPI003C2FCD93